MIAIEPQAFFFDFDGVVVDSERQHMLATLEALKDRPDLLFSEKYYFEELLGFDDVGMFEFLWDKNNATLTDEELKARMLAKNQILMKRLETESIFFPGVIDFIKSFKSKNIPIAVVSGARRKEILSCINKGNLQAAFEFVVSADDVQRSKPDPESYSKGFAQMQSLVPNLDVKNCWVIEDSPTGIESAKGAGMKVIGITNSLSGDHLKFADHIVAHYNEIQITKFA